MTGGTEQNRANKLKLKPKTNKPEKMQLKFVLSDIYIKTLLDDQIQDIPIPVCRVSGPVDFYINNINLLASRVTS